VNHSCDPNCEIDEVEGHIFIKTLRNLGAGEELTYDYWLYDGDDEAPCHCGSKSCRGSMYSPAEIKRMQRAAAKLRERETLAAQKKRRNQRARGNGAKSSGSA
jgi:uncharacterized protein